MAVPEEEGGTGDRRAGRDRAAGVGGPAEPAAGVGDRADGGPAATGPRRLADPGADLAGERRTVVTTARACRAGKADTTLSVMPLSHKYASESSRSLRQAPPAADTPEPARRSASARAVAPLTASPRAVATLIASARTVAARTATASAIAAPTVVGDRR